MITEQISCAAKEADFLELTVLDTGLLYLSVNEDSCGDRRTDTSSVVLTKNKAYELFMLLGKYIHKGSLSNDT